MGPSEERILTDRYCLRFEPGEHYWSNAVARVRFPAGSVQANLEEIRDLMRERGRTAAAWTIGPSAAPDGIVDDLLASGLESESAEGSVILTLTEAPHVAEPAGIVVRQVASYEDHLAALRVLSEGFSFSNHDAEDEQRRAREVFEEERATGHASRLVAFDGDRPVATGHGRFSPLGLYVGGGATIPSDRSRGAFSALLAEAWRGALARGTPALVTFGNTMSAPILQKMGFRPLGRVRHLIDRL